MMKLLQLIVITLILGGCMSDGGQTTTGTISHSSATQQLAAAVFNLEGATWGLIASGPRGAERSVAPGISITFDHEGKFSGQGGCNSFFGGYRADANGGLSVSQVNRSRKLCPPNIMQPENDFIAALGSVSSYILEDNRLHLFHPQGALIFSPN